MVEWAEPAIVLSARRHGESSLIVSVLTQGQGRQSGLMRGATRGRDRAATEPGAEVAARWKARLPEHLGQLALEVVEQHAAHLLDRPRQLAALASMLALIDEGLPEREAHPRLFAASLQVIQRLTDGSDWLGAYVLWECALLEELGFGLDLTHCAVTGQTDELRYVSPRSGRAVSEAAGAPYKDRLLPLPAFLTSSTLALDSIVAINGADAVHGVQLTGHFIERHLFEGRRPPPARARFVARLVAAPVAPDGAMV